MKSIKTKFIVYFEGIILLSSIIIGLLGFLGNISGMKDI